MGLYFLDQYSLLHFSFGIFAYFFKINFIHWIALHVMFEIIENSQFGMNLINKYVVKIWPGGKNYADTFINSMGDNFSAGLGWIVAFYINKLCDKYGLTPK